jgi:hypothetical protein
MKKKIIAIGVVLLLMTIPLTIVQAGEGEKTETIEVEISTYVSEGITTIETIFLTEEQITELEKTIEYIIEKAESIDSIEEFEKIVENLPKNNGPIMTIIFKIMSKFKHLKKRGFVVSHGQNIKINPFKKREINIREGFKLWCYLNNQNDKTVIFKPLSSGKKVKTLSGSQIGLMSKFTGLYIFIPKRFPQKSHTFFIGTARNIKGISLFGIK